MAKRPEAGLPSLSELAAQRSEYEAAVAALERRWTAVAEDTRVAGRAPAEPPERARAAHGGAAAAPEPPTHPRGGMVSHDARTLRFSGVLRAVSVLMLTAVLTLALLDALLVVRPLVSLFDWRIMAADGAMAPTIPAGSLVLARPQSAKSLTVGAVISFGMAGDTGRRVISRVVLLEERDNQIAVVSRGDASDLAQNGGATRDVGRLDMFSLLVPRDSPVDRVVGWLPYFASLATWPAPAIVRVGLATIIAIAAVLLSIQALRRKRWRLRPLA